MPRIMPVSSEHYLRVFKISVITSSVIISNYAMAGLPSGAYVETCEALNGIGGYPGVSETDRTAAQANFVKICSGADGGVAGLSASADDTAVSSLRHEEVAAQGTSTVKASQKQLSNVQERMEDLREEGESEILEKSRRSFFITGNFRQGEGSRTALESGVGGFGDSIAPTTDDLNFVQGERSFDVDGQEFTVGMDYRLDNEKTIVGIALGYDDRETRFTDQTATDASGNIISGGVDTKGFHVSGYATHALSDNAYLDGALSVGSSELDITRPVPKADPTLDGPASSYGVATGNTDSTQVSASIGGGYDFNLASMTLTPYTRFDYTKTSIDSYVENVADDSMGMALAIKKQETDSTQGTLGVRASKAIRTAKGVIVPQASVELIHEFAADARDIDATLPVSTGLDLTNPLSVVRTSEPDRNYAKLGLGVSAVFQEGHTGFVQVESLQGNDNLEDTAIRLGYRMEF